MHKHAAIDNMNDNVRQYLTKISEKKLSKRCGKNDGTSRCKPNNIESGRII